MPQKINIDFDRVTVEKLSTTITGLKDFKCSKPEFEEYLKVTAFNDQKQRIGQTWTFLYDDQIIGFITIAMSHLYKEDHKKLHDFGYGNIPALLIGQLATHKDYVESGVGEKMIHWAINEAYRYSEDIGCRIVMLNPEPDVVEWYKKRHFIHIPHKDPEMDSMFVVLDWVQ